ncbi:ABC transporter ATP-binding protein [Rubritalea marina]|uniref:ABC transporter ATP-binding protein n=1 Tax=Rubritalea marina TaxID=361055 RepID=UPI000377BF7F|nr:ABC transporter ATP-binding protein [Rubritalea marina]
MNKFLPYFKLILPVKWRFILAIVAGIIYGVASGFGLPFMASKVFPLLFSSDQQGLVLAVASSDLKPAHYDLGTQDEFTHIERLYTKTAAETYEKLEEGSVLSIDGTYLSPGSEIKQSIGDLFYLNDSDEYKSIQPTLYFKSSHQEYKPITQEAEKKSDGWFLFGVVMMLPAVFLVRGISGFTNTYQITYCGNFVLEHLRKDVFNKLQELDLSFFQKHGTGDLMTRIMTESARLQQMLTSAANDLIKQPVTFIAAVSSLIYMSIQQSEIAFILVCFAVIPAAIYPVRKLSKRMMEKMRIGAMGEGELGNCVQENLMAVRDVRSFNLEEREKSKFKVILDDFFRMIMKMTKYRAFINPSVEFITAVGVSVAIYYSAQNGLTLEKVLPLIFALYMSYEPIKRMGALQNQLVLGAVAIERLEGVLNAEVGVKDPENPKVLPQLSGKISFRNVLFNYEEGEPALNRVNAEIAPGEIVALVGPSGAGKSTFTHLISRSYDFEEGHLLFDELDVRDYKLHDLRANVSVVSQDPYLFNDTVENNIRLGKLDASEEEIREAARLAHCHEFIEKLPNSYHTIVGEKATRLSGGQRQRLAIARAFLKDSPILILDEATSALDAESEQAVQGALEELVRGRTTLIIAHRFSSIKIAHRILVFDAGKIVAEGTHEELMLESDLYKSLHEKQILD